MAGPCDNPQPGNVQFSYAQLEYLWETAGGNPQVSPIAAAIAMAESEGNSGATDCDSNGSVDRGLWQINSVHGSLSTYDPMSNARAAVSISNNGTNWGAWTTYSSGRYRQFLQVGVAPSSAPINATNATANQPATLDASLGPIHVPSGWGLLNPADWFNTIVGGATSSVSNAVIGTVIQGVVSTILNPFLSIAAGIMGVGAGGLMVLFGIIVMVRNTETEQRMEQGIGKAAQTAVGLVAPETKAVTAYQSAGGATTRVTSTRRPARQMKVGGRNVRFGQATVRTDVQRPERPATVSTALNQEAQAYKRTQNPSQAARAKAAAQNRRLGGYRSESTSGSPYTGPRTGGRN